MGGALVVLASLALAATAHASGDLSRLAGELTRLRAEVESLSDAITDAKTRTQTELRAAAGQKTELELALQREEMRLTQLTRKRETHLAAVARSQAAKGKLAPNVLASIDRVREGVKRSLPFKRAERVAALDAIASQLDEGLLGPEKAASRLWQFAEDELRLTRESGLYQQTLTVDGEEVLAEVARVGMVAMYFQTSDGRVGRVARRGEEWVTETLTAERDVDRLRALFDAFKKGVRQGFFEIPSPMLEGAAR
jgi:hypothetical protein